MEVCTSGSLGSLVETEVLPFSQFPGDEPHFEQHNSWLLWSPWCNIGTPCGVYKAMLKLGLLPGILIVCSGLQEPRDENTCSDDRRNVVLDSWWAQIGDTDSWKVLRELI